MWKLERACVLVVMTLVSIMKDQDEELTRLGLRAFDIGLRDKKGQKTFDRFSIFIAFHLRVSPVGDQTTVGRLELLVDVLH